MDAIMKLLGLLGKPLRAEDTEEEAMEREAMATPMKEVEVTKTVKKEPAKKTDRDALKRKLFAEAK
jgi:hypothetical protein